MHGTLKSIEGPPNLGINLPFSIKPTTPNSANQSKDDAKSMNGKEKLEKKSPSPVKKSVEPKKVANPGWTCWECDRLFTQRDVYISHVRKEHGKVSDQPRSCGSLRNQYLCSASSSVKTGIPTSLGSCAAVQLIVTFTRVPLPYVSHAPRLCLTDDTGPPGTYPVTNSKRGGENYR